MAEFTGPSMLYFQQDGQLVSRQFEDREAYDAALEAGWKTSPADFGIETHPSTPTQVAMGAALAPPAVAQAVSAEMQEAITVLLTMRTQHEAMVANLAGLAERVTALEQARAAAPVTGPIADDDEHPQTRTRRS